MTSFLLKLIQITSKKNLQLPGGNVTGAFQHIMQGAKFFNFFILGKGIIFVR
jgi:hypothetical protein